MKINIISGVKKAANSVAFFANKNAPTIFIVAGVGGLVAATVTAIHSTLKVDEILAEHKDTVEKIKSASEDEQFCERNDYSEEDATKDLTATYLKTGWKLVKLYSPTILLAAAGTTAVLYGHHILGKRSAALATACTSSMTAFREYRERVAAKWGSDAEREIRLGVKTEELETTVTEDGEEKTIVSTVTTIDPELCNYVRVFDETNKYWSKSGAYNMNMLLTEQEHANHVLKSRVNAQGKGYLTLNEVLERLGFPPTKEGMVIGWVYDTHTPRGDNYVDFGLYDQDGALIEDFMDGKTKSIVLEFNVDGPIMDLM